MNKREAARLQRMINRAVATINAAKTANDELMDWCREHYGYEPGDIDADYIIDTLGGCGYSEGMSAEKFDEIMRSA